MKKYEQAFRLEEYRILRSEIELTFQLAQKVEQQAFVALFAIYGFQLGTEIMNADARGVVWFIPAVIAIFTTIRLDQYFKGVLNMGNYIQSQIEAPMFGTPQADMEDGHTCCGWETHLRSGSSHTFVHDGLGPVQVWIIVSIATLLIALYKFCTTVPG